MLNTYISTILSFTHGRRKVHDYFLLLLCKSSIWFTEKRIFKIIIYFFNMYIKMCRKLCHLIWGTWCFHRSKYFEAMEAGKLAVWPWLSCQYTKNTLMNLPSSMVTNYSTDVQLIFQSLDWNIHKRWKFRSYLHKEVLHGEIRSSRT